MRFSINSVIYFYIFICVSLLVFNVLYILRSKGRSRSELRRIERWSRLMEDLSPDPAYMERKLKRIGELTAFHAAIEPKLGEERTKEYLAVSYEAFRNLAIHYRRRPAMERAFFAYVVSRYRFDGVDSRRLAVLLLEFLEDSTVYCRENVLQALYALGNAGAVEQVLRMMNDREWYHHSKLLSDGLTTFSGDRPALAARLWDSGREWNENLKVAIVQFAANVTDRMTEAFARALAAPDVPQELCFALIRYFGRYPAQEAQTVLLKLAGEGIHEGGPAIAACQTLARYPGEDTLKVLNAALLGRNWYVRRGAAQALLALEGPKKVRMMAQQAGDRYAREMLEYVNGMGAGKGATG